MSDRSATNTSSHVYRIDKFAVPPTARDELLTRVRETHAFLRTLPGYVSDSILEHADGASEFNLVTILEWETAAAMASARPLVAAMQHRGGFDAREFLGRMGIRADMGSYRQVAP
jgi:heme-degrading monooxygenase HmoA